MLLIICTIGKGPPFYAPDTEGYSKEYLIKTHSPQHLNKALRLAGVELKNTRNLSGMMTAATLSSRFQPTYVNKILKLLAFTYIVDYAILDDIVRPVTAHSQPDLGAFFELQWQFGDSQDTPAAINLARAWEQAEGSPSTIIAVVDSGVRYDHPDLTGRLLTGYDFVSDPMQSNDGDGRDSDASDPGDGVSQEMAEYYQSVGTECKASKSSWHGTAVTSLIVGNGFTTNGLSGIDRYARVLPVRVIGQCGGRRSDLLDAIRWAAGVSDIHLPPNPTPARIINVSINILGNCTRADQDAIDDAVNSGAIIVVGAGNSGQDLARSPTSPTSCRNVISVGAVNSKASRAIYSNYGAQIDLVAPGGESADGDGREILAASNTGLQHAVQGNHYRRHAGTSMATPLVSGVLGLMLSANTSLNNHTLYELLVSATRGFPKHSTAINCTSTTCGTGLLDAASAVRASFESIYANDDTSSNPLGSDGFDDQQDTNIGAGTIDLWLLLLLCFFSRRNFEIVLN